MAYTHTCPNPDCAVKYDIEITHFVPSRPAYISGLPENSYPAEGAEVEFTPTPCPECGLVDESDALVDAIIEAEEDAARDACYDDDYDDDRDDYDYDDPRNDFIM